VKRKLIFELDSETKRFEVKVETNGEEEIRLGCSGLGENEIEAFFNALGSSSTKLFGVVIDKANDELEEKYGYRLR
jgi:hypothetical protein